MLITKLVRILTYVSLLLVASLYTSKIYADNNQTAGKEADSSNRLIILNWPDYLDPEIVVDFENAYNATVSQIYYETDEHRTMTLAYNQAEGYDLILTSGADLAPYSRNKWIQPLDYSQLPNSRHVIEKFNHAFSNASTYGIPFFWGTVGIIYRNDLIKPKDPSWSVLFEPESSLQGKIGMIADSRDLIGTALKSMGYSINSSDPSELKAAQQLLHNQKQYVRSYEYMTLDESSEILSGDIHASLIYNGDALMLMEYSEKLSFFVPREGTNLWVDYFALGAKAQNPNLAYAFLNYINEPHIAAKMASYTHYATPNEAARVLLPKELSSNPLIYPSREVVARSEFYRPPTAIQSLSRQRLSTQLLAD